MKINFNLFLTQIFLFVTIACISDGDFNSSETPSVFKGNWVGTYSGNENGTITFSVSNSGGFFGDKISNSGIKEGFNGYAKIGDFGATTPSNFVFISNNTPNNYEISGTWSQNNLKGTFIVKKK